MLGISHIVTVCSVIPPTPGKARRVTLNPGYRRARGALELLLPPDQVTETLCAQDLTHTVKFSVFALGLNMLDSIYNHVL